MQYILLFLEGIITFISPCLLPMLPVYLTFFAAGEANKRRAFCNALGFVLGFTAVFVALGAFAGTLGKLLRAYEIYVNLVTGLIVIVLGLHFLGVLRLGFLQKLRRKQVDTRQLRFGSSVLFGLAFSVGWTPCVGAFLGSALMLASQQGSTWKGVIMLLVYSMGLGIPFMACALLMDRLKGAVSFLQKKQKVIHIISGALLILVGIMMATGLMGYLLRQLTFL